MLPSYLPSPIWFTFPKALSSTKTAWEASNPSGLWTTTNFHTLYHMVDLSSEMRLTLWNKGGNLIMTSWLLSK